MGKLTDVAFWKATAVRLIRTFITTILGVWTGSQLITEIDWKVTLLSAFSATVYILLLCILGGLPEVKDFEPYYIDEDGVVGELNDVEGE